MEGRAWLCFLCVVLQVLPAVVALGKWDFVSCDVLVLL